MSSDNALDRDYIHKQISKIQENIGNYTVDEFARAMLRLAKVADEKVFNESEFCTKPKEEGVQQSNSVQGTLRKTDKSSKFVRFAVDSPVAEHLLYSYTPMLHKERVEVLQVMVINGSWLLAEYVVLPQSN